MQGKQPLRSVFQLVDGRSLCLMQLVQAVSATLNMLTSYNASQAPGSLLCEISYHRQLCDNGISMASEHKDVWESLLSASQASVFNISH